MNLQRSVGVDGYRALGPTDARLHEDALDGMRGVAALLVVLSHLSTARMHLIPGLDLKGVGKPGVYLFFVLSAFLLTRQILGRERAALTDRALWARYFARRFLRIFPLLAFVLVLSYALGRLFGLGLPFRISGPELIPHLTLRAGKGVLWSIPPEFQYYFVLPAVGAAFVLTRGHEAIALGACLLVIVFASQLWPPSLAIANAAYLGPYLPVFLLGSVAALVHGQLVRAAASARRRALYEGGALICGMAVGVTIPLVYRALSGRPIPSNHFNDSLIFYGVVWSGFLVCTLLGSGWCRAALSTRAIRYFGLISFSVYLWHMAVIRLVRNLSPFAAIPSAWLTLALILGVASASYLLIERPFQKLRIGGVH